MKKQFFKKLRNSNFKENIMKHIYFSRKIFSCTILVLTALLFVISFTSCDEPKISGGSIYGRWKSQYNDSYIISENKIMYNDGGYGIGWTGKLIEISNDYIYFQYDENDENYTVAPKGYCAVAYKNLTEKGCQMGTAYKANGKESCTTLGDAKTEFTIKNGYFEYFGEYAKK